jgi:protocatechuate 3,4-dioxygenase beta subunit
MPSTGGLTSPPWTAVPVQDSSTATPKTLACNVVTKTDGAGQGPFFIHELEKMDDIGLLRQDIRGQYNPTAEKGIDMELHVRLIDKTKSDASCGAIVPVADIEVYIWHTDGQGYYSGFGMHGGADEQKPDAPYNGTPGSNNLENTDRFCRGIQVTDSNGVASFLSTFPGWYNGRDLHIHIVCFKKGSTAHGRANYTKSNEKAWIFTTQFYFDPAFSKSIHESAEPYKRRTSLSAYADAMAANESGNSGRHATATKVGNKVVAQIQMVVDPT